MNQAQIQLSVANFKAGSYIIIENKKDRDFFFIVRQGKVQVESSVQNLTGSSTRLLKAGDFFGVIGAMTGHARIETAIAVENTSLIAVKKSQFGFLIQKNTPLAMKIIRSFSRDLRLFDSELAKRTSTGEQHDEDNPENLFFTAEYYFKHDQIETAVYIYIQYLKNNPFGENVDLAKSRISTVADLDLGHYKSHKDFNRTYSDGELLFSEHEPGHELYIIQNGKVKITKIISNKEILIAVLNAGDIFGEMALLDNKNRSASAIAFGDTTLMAVNRANFEKIVVQNTAMATKLITLLSDRIWTIYKQLANLLYTKPVARLWDTLLTQMLKDHVQFAPKQPYHFTFGTSELLKMVGLDGQEGDKAVNELLSHKNIQIMGNKIYCDDISVLKKEVEFFQKMQERESKREASRRRQNLGGY